MEEMKLDRTQRRREIQTYLDMIHSMSESTDDYLFLIDYDTKRVHIENCIEAKYTLPLSGEEGFDITEWKNTVYSRDVGPVMQDLERVLNGEKKSHNMEYRMIDRQGKRCWISCRGKVYNDSAGDPLLVLGRVSDTVFGQKTDALTGLLNGRKYLEDISSSVSKGRDGCLLIFGMDSFKDINVKYGRTFGNHLLKRIADALEETIDPAFLLYRLDGDRFAVNLIFQGKEEAETIYHSMKERLSSWCTISAGAVLYSPELSRDGDILYQYAESALDWAKKQGKNKLIFFSNDEYEEKRNAAELMTEMRQSIRHNFAGFYLCYQPQMSCQECSLYGVEVLLRYHSPSRGLISPIEFIPLLEQSELICHVGRWVLQQALRTAREWRRHIPELHISINVSFVQLREKGITDFVLKALREADLPGEALTLEVTESMQLQDYQYYNRIFCRWEKEGIRIAIDDFGTGYSSLSYLKSIMIDEIKIDRCFVRGIQNSTYNYQLLRNTIELARSTQISVCCEGVETEDELLTLKELMPDRLQGYLFSVPCCKEQFENMYINSDQKEYGERVERERHYSEVWKKTDDISFSADSTDLISIVESMEEMVCVTDPESCELYYMNSAGRRITGTYDYKGRKCYEVMYGKTSPCHFCANAVLPRNEFRVREIENSFLRTRFLMKEKLIPWNKKPARLEITVDITEKKDSQSLRVKEEFEEVISSCSRIFLEETNTNKAIMKVLRKIGNYYLADRAYIFEPLKDSLCWRNTYEWCQKGIAPQKEKLQEVSSSMFRRWMSVFQSGQSVMIKNRDEIMYQSREEWESLQVQKVQRLIAAPVMKDKEIIGIIGVDNPKKNVQEDNLLRIMTYFLADRLMKGSGGESIHDFLRYTTEDILSATQLGLWIICIHENPDDNELFADRNMLRLMGLDHALSPTDCYRHWYGRVNEGYYHYVDVAVEKMLSDQRMVQIEYTWNHPRQGEVVVRCVGVRGDDLDDCPSIIGYHRIISDIDRPNAVQEGLSRAVFEYNDKRKSIYFHHGMELLDVSSDKADNFPECWIREGVVHPDFAEIFSSVFVDVYKKEELNRMEVLLRGIHGTYEWFNLKTRHISTNQEDLHTIMVLLDVANQQRIMELENLRKNDFYEAMLSETIAYAEIEISTGRPLKTGGLWRSYEEECRQWNESFYQVVKRHLPQTVTAEDLEKCSSFFEESYMWGLYVTGNHTAKHNFRRISNGVYHWMEMVIHVFQERYTESTFALLYLKDIDMEKKKELAQALAADTDPLTKVYNRRMFEEEVMQFIRRKEGSNSGTLLLFDIDNFKSINDRFGHLEGDAALMRMTDILMSTFRQRDIVGRLGGDEFLAFLKDVTSRDILDRRINEMRQALRMMEGVQLTCSVGITFIHGEEYEYDEYLKQADLALYRSKQLGKDRAYYYEDMQQHDT